TVTSSPGLPWCVHRRSLGPKRPGKNAPSTSPKLAPPQWSNVQQKPGSPPDSSTSTQPNPPRCCTRYKTQIGSVTHTPRLRLQNLTCPTSWRPSAHRYSRWPVLSIRSHRPTTLEQ